VVDCQLPTKKSKLWTSPVGSLPGTLAGYALAVVVIKPAVAAPASASSRTSLRVIEIMVAPG
jgi:hypothetical protein